MEMVEERAYSRLRQLRDRGLWDGRPPVPVDHVIEHLLKLTISWEVVSELAGEQILACLRPEAMEVVLNEARRGQFETMPGLERFSLAHEAGHADVFALTALSEQLGLIARDVYKPAQRSAARGPVAVILGRLPEMSREALREVLQTLKELDRARQVAGEDTPFVRRTVDHYAAVLLMPEEAVRSMADGLDLSRWSTIQTLASDFQVSRTAMRIRLEECRLIHGVDERGQVVLKDPGATGQGEIFH